MNKAKKLLVEKLILPYLCKNTNYIGVELEYPLICLDDQVNTKQLILDLFEHLKTSLDFKDDTTDVDGNLISVKNSIGDKITLEGRYEIIEFAMQKDLSLNSIAKRFFEYFKFVQAFLREHNCFLTGMGTNLTDSCFNVHSMKNNFWFAANDYIRKYTAYKDPRNFLINTHTTIQTHFEVCRDNFSHLNGEADALLKTLNLFNRLDFVRAILFSNALPNPAATPINRPYPKNILCTRDFDWKNSQFPNVGTANAEFSSIDNLAEYLSKFELFFKLQDGKYVAFKGPTIAEYFSNPEQIDDVLDIFKPLQNVVLNSYATVEVRSDCTQPLKDTFASVAFNVGISHKVEEASEITARFFRDNKIELSNSALRDMAINDVKIADDKIMRQYLQELYDLASAALKARGFGEEQHLKCLQERIDTLMCPAKKQKLMLAEGVPLDEIILQCSEL